jgi:hypothetical protein
MTVRKEPEAPTVVKGIGDRVVVTVLETDRWSGLLREMSMIGFRVASPKIPLFSLGQVLKVAISTKVINKRGKHNPIVVYAECRSMMKKGAQKPYFSVRFAFTEVDYGGETRLKELIHWLSGRTKTSHSAEPGVKPDSDSPSQQEGKVFQQLDTRRTTETWLSDQWIDSASEPIPQETEIACLNINADDPTGVPGRKIERRRSDRHYLAVSVPVYDENNRLDSGMIENISKHGIGIAGMECRLGETRNLVVDWPGLAEDGSLTFAAVCRWRQQDPHGLQFAGFEITDISESSSSVLRQLIQRLSMA